MSWIDSCQISSISQLFLHLFLFIQIVLRCWLLIRVVVMHNIIALISILIDKWMSHLRSSLILLIFWGSNQSILVHLPICVHGWIGGGILLLLYKG